MMGVQRIGRARLEILVTLALAAVAGTAIALPGILSNQSSDRVRTEAAPSTTTTTVLAPVATTLAPDAGGSPIAGVEPPTTTTPETTLPPPPPTTAPPPLGLNGAPAHSAATTTTRRTTTTVRRVTTTAPCHNSTEPRCGEFLWDPAPGDNAPLSVSIEPTSSDIHVGDTVVFHVEASDPDGHIDDASGCGYAVGFGDGEHSGGCRRPAECGGRYGPWSPPARVAGSYSGNFTHTYTSPGRYNVDIGLNLNGGSCYDVYRSSGSDTVSIEVNR
jgi:hypothetical protein